jgi:hypothetical protein
MAFQLSGKIYIDIKDIHAENFNYLKKAITYYVNDSKLRSTYSNYLVKEDIVINEKIGENKFFEVYKVNYFNLNLNQITFFLLGATKTN